MVNGSSNTFIQSVIQNTVRSLLLFIDRDQFYVNRSGILSGAIYVTQLFNQTQLSASGLVVSQVTKCVRSFYMEIDDCGVCVPQTFEYNHNF